MTKRKTCTLRFAVFSWPWFSPPAPRPLLHPRAGATSDYASAPPDRPGLGTRWGETRRSLVSATNFERATPVRPLAIAEIFYNDRAGI